MDKNLLPTVLLLLFLTISKVKSDCNGEWVQGVTSDKCIRAFSSAVMWGDAEQVCAAWGGYLASVSNAFENAHVASYAKTVLNASVYWLGGSTYYGRFDPYYNWTWTDGANMTYNRWARNQLCVINDNCCLIQNSTDQYWYISSCEAGAPKYPYICELLAPTTVVPPSTTPWPGNCPDGWAYFNKTQKCYAPVTEEDEIVISDFNYTRNWCMNNFGADLVSIHSQEENQWLVEFLNAQDIGVSWIGLYNPHVTGKWEWTDGTPVDFTSWGDNEPAPNTYCTILFMNDYLDDIPKKYKYKWYAQDVDDLTVGVCELPAKGHTQPTRKPTTPAFTNKCDLTWEYYDLTKKCYKNMGFEDTFDRCRASCQQAEADLPTIHSAEETELLINFLILSADGEGLNGIGLYSPNLDGNFQWIDGSPLNFTSWAVGEPQTLTYSAILNIQGSARGKWTTLSSDYFVGCFCAKNAY